MKKLLFFALFLSAVLLVGLSWQEHPVAHGGPVADPELPATGQALCKDADGTVPMPPDTSCDVTECPGQDGDLRVGCPAPGEARFVILPGPNGIVDPIEDHQNPDDTDAVVDDTVFDRCTGLEWQRGTADIGGPGEPLIPDGLVNGDDRRTWSEAITYCEGLDYGGHTDWRLPNAMELQSIVDYGRVEDEPATRGTLVDPAFTLGKYPVAANRRSFHWTSTSRPSCIDNVDPPRVGLCRAGMAPDSTPDILFAVYVEFANGGAGQSPLRSFNRGTEQFEEDTVYLVRAVRRGINAGAGGGGVHGDGAERGGGAGPLCVAANGNANGDGARDLSDAVYELAWLFQGGPVPVPFCTTPGPKAEGCAVENGNTNGDGARDLSDVVYLLAWLFQGGAEPVPPCPTLGAPEVCTGGVDEDLDGATDCADADCVLLPICDIASVLPATGVTICYDETGQTLLEGCAGTGQDGEYQTGCALTGMDRFVRHEGPDGPDAVNSPVNDTVTDMCTGLEWQWQRADTNGDGKIGLDDNPATPDFNENDNLPWCEAVAYANDDLNQGNGFAEKKGWRYPNVRELYSLMLFGNTHPLPAGNNLIDPIFGTAGNGVQGECSSTVQVGERAFCVLFDRPGIIDGVGGGALKLGFDSGIRAVRTADPPP